MKRPLSNFRPFGPYVSAQKDGIEVNEVGTRFPEQGIAYKLVEVGEVEPERFYNIEVLKIVSGDEVAMAAYYYSGDVAIMGKVEVKPELRNQGIGTMIKEEALDDMRDRGVNEVYTVVSSKAGRALVKKTGFTQDAPYFTYDDSVMYREL